MLRAELFLSAGAENSFLIIYMGKMKDYFLLFSNENMVKFYNE